MNAEALKPPRLPFNGRMLRWAREWRGRSIDDAAKKLNTNPANIEAWERGESVPSVRQARMLAGFYERGFLEFFLDRPPPVVESALVPDFRLHRDAADPTGDRELRAIQSWAEEQRLNALDLFEMLGDAPPEFPAELFATIASNPETVASAARKVTALAVEDQMGLEPAQRPTMPKLFRRAIERLGVLVLKESALAKYGVRGLCVFATPLPVIVYGTEAPAAQSFTMAHELAHVILQQSAISGPPSARDTQSATEAVERWCDQFAGAFLIPADAMGTVWAKPNSALPAIGDDMLGKLANTFCVSRHAMLIRLVHLGYVEPAFYWDVKRPEFLKQEREFKGGGRAKYYGTRYRSSHGDLYTGLVLEAWGSGVITNHNAAEFMGIKNLRHLTDIRDDFLS
ncbi:XRE family transcriptional regulator [Sphingomonas sp. IC-56]|uniref:XRE family transcriptional regulator n=1 Tax=Sphingomonas sp. IC-56 TaxID=2898529 RepID=UPI001E52B77C|nr:XRE family transcriptional regulator [Sphingomonas sp. IC-56]MCD2325017.1 XRE family transcriptional regulator [Sphingomonas sp. IC-56]